MIDLTDRNFGRLTVIDMAGLDRTGHKLWSCLCDCCNYRKFKPKKGHDKCKSASDAQTRPRCRVVSIADALSLRQAP